MVSVRLIAADFRGEKWHCNGKSALQTNNLTRFTVKEKVKIMLEGV